jgi:hypothetical protein
MAELELRLPSRPIVNVDASITVKQRGQVLGELLISRGSLDWRPAKHQYPIKMSWRQFAKLMEKWDNGEIS